MTWMGMQPSGGIPRSGHAIPHTSEPIAFAYKCAYEKITNRKQLQIQEVFILISYGFPTVFYLNALSLQVRQCRTSALHQLVF